jgi:uncharacterized membrane protein
MAQPETVADLEKKPDEFALAGIVYVSFLVGSLLFSGIMLGVCSQKSEYARFQIAQVFATQVAWLIGLFCYIAFFIVAVFLTAIGSIAFRGAPFAACLIIPLHFLVIFGTMGMNLALLIAGLMKCLKGDDFTIPIVGKWVFRRFFQGTRPAA